MQELIQGIHRFKSDVFATNLDFYRRLADGQKPQALFITCSDSRMAPDLICQTQPGELFVLRNAGNIVPPYSPGAPSGEAATIEYAIRGLDIRNIIICGHTRCGAMQAVSDPASCDNMPRVKQWLEHAQAGAEIVCSCYQHLPFEARWKVLSQENVLVQIENLRTHPAVAAAMAAGELKLHAWMYKMETGEVFAYDPNSGQFNPLVCADGSSNSISDHAHPGNSGRRAGNLNFTAVGVFKCLPLQISRIAIRCGGDAIMAQPTQGIPVDSSRGGWRNDVLASLVVFMVALPLCIGIAQACGLPPEAGLVTGIVGGILVGFLAGSPLQVSGPAAGLIVLVIQFLDDAHKAGYAGVQAFYLLGVVILLSGAIQIVAGLLRCGQWFRAVSPAVVGGMLAGIGITIIAKQFHSMVDDDAPKRVLDGLLTIPLAVWKGFSPPPGAEANHSAAALIGVITILILVFWKAIAPKSLKLVPAAVVAVCVAVGVTELAGLSIDRVRVSGDIAAAFSPIPWLGWEAVGSGLVLKAAFTFAIIASAETLLCAVAVDSMHTGPRTKFDRELVAQGVGNMVCGAFAALPMTGVIVRSSANVEAGAKTRLSAILHGFWLLLFVAFLPGLLSRIPESRSRRSSYIPAGSW